MENPRKCFEKSTKILAAEEWYKAFWGRGAWCIEITFFFPTV